MPALSHFNSQEPFLTESGHELKSIALAYTTHGKINSEGSNVVWIFHALTANSDPLEWWPGLAGKNKLFDPAADFIICVNMPGSCYGSINPLVINPGTGKKWFHNFPLFTIRDMVKAYSLLRDELGITSVKLAIGGSMGGQQALEWAISEPGFFHNLVLIATNAKHSPWGIAFNASQRLAIESDATWKTDKPDAGASGMLAARSIALLSYRGYDAYRISQQDDRVLPEINLAESYQRYQGEKLVKRFNAFSYYFLSRGMDSHNVGRHRGSIVDALKRINSRTLVIGITSDLLFPPVEQEFLAQEIPDARLKLIHSDFGHDGFLLEYEQLDPIIRNFLNEEINLNAPVSVAVPDSIL